MPRRSVRRAVLFPAVMAAGAALAEGQATFYSWASLAGDNKTVSDPEPNLRVGDGFAVSALVRSGRWEICTLREFRGRCVVLEPGEYPNLQDRFGWVRSAREISGIAEGSPHYRRYWTAREERRPRGW